MTQMESESAPKVEEPLVVVHPGDLTKEQEKTLDAKEEDKDAKREEANDEEMPLTKEEKPPLPEGYELNELDKTIYSLVFTGGLKSIGFWYALVICAFQTTIIALVIKDTLDFENENNPMRIPAGNDWTVLACQVLLFFILPQLADDMMRGLEFLIDGYNPEVLEMSPDATQWSWALSGFLQFCVGAVGLFLVFTLLMQAVSVIGLGAKYVSFGFFAKIDKVAFTVAKTGMCSVRLQSDIKAVKKVQILKSTSYTWRRRIRDTFLFLGLLIAWAILTHRVLAGWYLCDQLFVQVGDIFNPRIVELSGMYDMQSFDEKVANRAVYYDRDVGLTKLAYCGSTQKWTMSEIIQGEEWDPCQNIIAQSKKDVGYDILKTADSWNVVRPIGGGYKPFTHFSMVCNKCEANCNSKGGACDERKRCVCDSGYFGVNCQYKAPCTDITLNKHSKPFPNEELGLIRFPQYFELLTLNEGSDATSKWGTFQVEFRPVFYGENGIRQYIMFFLGRRWVIIEAIINDQHLRNKAEVVDYMSDPKQFNSVLSKFRPYFASSPMDRDTPSDSVTPAKLQWYEVRTNIDLVFSGNGTIDAIGQTKDYQGQAGLWWAAAEDEPVSTFLHCAFCDKFQNPCENQGRCDFDQGPWDDPSTGVCVCPSMTSGSLCEYEMKCTDRDEDDASIKIGCQSDTAICTSSGKCENCPVGTYGSLCQLDVDCHYARDFLDAKKEFAVEFDGCFHGGTCDETRADPRCGCPDPYYGNLCQFGGDNNTVVEDLDGIWPF